MVAVGLVGCTASDEPTASASGAGTTAGATATPTAAAPVEPTPTADPTPTGPPPDFSTLEPTEPDADAGEAYLAGRVPDGMDPAAVLEAGVEACDRMRYLATVDEDTLIEALQEGTESKDWPAAIEHLCPDLADYAEQAGVAS
jgi:hypothetical protein